MLDNSPVRRRNTLGKKKKRENLANTISSQPNCHHLQQLKTISNRIALNTLNKIKAGKNTHFRSTVSNDVIKVTSEILPRKLNISSQKIIEAF